MVANEVIDFLMAELASPKTCPGKIRQAVKQIASLHAGASIGRSMLNDQLIDVLFELYANGLSDTVELGMSLKQKLNRYIHSRFTGKNQTCRILPLRRRSRTSRVQCLEGLHF